MKTIYVILLFIMFTFVANNSFAKEFNLAGKWNNGNVNIEQHNEVLKVHIGNRGPYKGSYSKKNGTLLVDFKDDPGCCTAKISKDGSTLSWSNGTVWKKVKTIDLSGRWSNGVATIKQTKDKVFVYVGNRGPFKGHYSKKNRTLLVDFKDDAGCCTAKVSKDGNTLKWSNNTTWAKVK